MLTIVPWAAPRRFFVECPAETRGVVVVPLDRLSIRIERNDVVEVAGRNLDRLGYSGVRARHRA